MRARNWKRWHPSCLSDAIEGCLGYALDKHRRSVDRIADLVGESKWTIYKWVQSGAIPSRKIPGFEHACGIHYVTGYLANAAHKLLIDLPTGRAASASNILELQAVCNDAVGALLGCAAGEVTAEAAIQSITTAITGLAYERAQLQHHTQPELDLL